MPTTISADLAARAERARALTASWEGRPGVLGTFLYGSSVRPYADASSDYDVRVILENDAFAAVPVEEVHTYFSEGGKKVSDVWLTSRDELENPTRDVERHRARHAHVLFDPEGTVAAILSRVAEMPSTTREARLRVHYYELTYLAQKVQNAHRRASRTPALLINGQLVLAAAKVLFVERSEWPVSLSWVFEELLIAGIPTELVEALRAVLETAEPRAIRTLRGKLDGYLIDHGITFIQDPVKLWEWLFHTPEGGRAQAEWAGEGLRIC